MKSKRVSDAERVRNQLALHNQIQAHEHDTLTLNHNREYITEHYGFVLSKKGKFIIVVHGLIYRVVFAPTTTVIFTTPVDRNQLG